MKRIFIAILLIVFVQTVFSQKVKTNRDLFEKAKSAYRAGNTALAIQSSLKILKSDSLDINTHLLLADIYNRIDSVCSEIKHLEFVFGNSLNKNNLVGYRLGEAYFNSGNYQKSLDTFIKTLVAGDISIERRNKIEDRIKRCRFAIEAKDNPVSGEAKNIGEGVNTDSDEYWPALSIDGKTLVFTRLIKPGKQGGFNQEDFYTSLFSNNRWETAKPISEINTPENEGAQTLSADGKLLFFTACNRDDGLGSCDIYFSRFIGNEWTKPQNAGTPLNTGAWESQPSLTANSGYLYFASNRTGGKGGMDIWRCKLFGFKTDGKPSWGIPENLGDSINSPGNELSPFIHFNGRDLYFSSDYWIGLGKKDIFHSRLKSDLTWGQPENIGYPINTKNDEQGFIIDAKGTTAYYASNLSGNMDIYSFELYPEIRPLAVTYIKGKVIDAGTKQILKAEIELRDIKQGYIDTVWTDDLGEFLVSLPLGGNYAFNVSKEGYLFYSEAFELKNVFEVAKPFKVEILLHPLVVGSNMVLRNIYFDTNSFELLPESQPELEKLESFLKRNPGIAIEIEGHTDNVGSEDYNLVLSENRAKAVYDYLIKKGIEKQRLGSKGYGFSRPISPNETDEGKSQNRRTEIKILQIKKPPQ